MGNEVLSLLDQQPAWSLNLQAVLVELGCKVGYEERLVGKASPYLIGGGLKRVGWYG